jgi:trk system potassium uptake protein TrkA
VLQLGPDVEVVELVVPTSAQRVTGRKVSEVTWPEGCVLVALLHGSTAGVPGPDDQLAVGDTLYAVVARPARRAFMECFT